MGEHTPADSVEIKVKDDEYINLDNLKIRACIHQDILLIVIVF